jgi:hypothetical protein
LCHILVRLDSISRGYLNLGIPYSKRQLALLQLLQSSAEPEHLTWTGLSLLSFKPACESLISHVAMSITHNSPVTLAIAIIMNAQNPENEELEEWIAMAQGMLEVLQPKNALAPTALDQVHIIRKRTLFLLGVINGRCNTNDPAVHARSGVAPSMSLPQRLDRATRVLSQPQPCLIDQLGREEAMDPFWATIPAGIFAGHFPGIESLSGPVNPKNLEQFLDSCLSMHSRMPHTYTF